MHHARSALKASEAQTSGRMDGFQGQMAETENQFTVSEREAKASLQLFQTGGKSGLFRRVTTEEGKTFQRETFPSREGKQEFPAGKASLLFQKEWGSLVWGLFFLDLWV